MQDKGKAKGEGKRVRIVRVPFEIKPEHVEELKRRVASPEFAERLAWMNRPQVTSNVRWWA